MCIEGIATDKEILFAVEVRAQYNQFGNHQTSPNIRTPDIEL